jgi:hypothetical protein
MPDETGSWWKLGCGSGRHPRKKEPRSRKGAFVNTQTKLCAVLMVFFMVLSSVPFADAEEEEADTPSANLNVSFFSQYVWRGYELSKDSFVIFPSLTVGYKGFDLNVWVDFDTHYKGTGTHELWETDWVLTYSNNWEVLSFRPRASTAMTPSMSMGASS